MVNVLVVWGLLLAVVVGWGLFVVTIVRRLGGTAFGGGMSGFQTAWLGYCGLQVFLQVAAFFVAINNLAFALSCVPAVAGYWLQRGVIRRRIASLRLNRRGALVVAAAASIAWVFLALASFAPISHYDTGLYHLQSVKWIASYPVVTGVANLHYRFGYNNGVHLFDAYTDTLWEGVSSHIANGFLLGVALSQWLAEILLARTPRQRVRQVFCVFTLPFLLAKLWVGEVASLSTDLPLTVFAFVFLLELVSLPLASSQRFMLQMTLVLALAAIATTTKLGGLSLLAVAAVVALVIARKQILQRAWLVSLALPVLALAAWMARGIKISGWLMYPVFGHLPVSWAVPKSLAENDFGNIQSWSRMWKTTPDVIAQHDYWWWFKPWFEAFRGSHEFALLAIAGLLLVWRAAHRPVRVPVRPAGEWGAICACILGMLVWFNGAPDLRYGNFWFWMLPAAVLAPMLSDAMRDTRLRTGVFSFSLIVVYWAGGFNVQLAATPPKIWGRPPMPQRMATKLVDGAPGTKVRVPVDNQKGEDRCFDEPLPCAPYGDHQVVRDPSDLSAGYRSVNP